MSIKDIPIQPPVKRGRGRPPKVATPVETPSQEKLETASNLLRASGALFDTLDLEVYKTRLDSLSLNELHNEAIRVGLKTGTDRSNCTRAILEVFTDYRNKFLPSYTGFITKDGLSDEKRAIALKLMQDGK